VSEPVRLEGPFDDGVAIVRLQAPPHNFLTEGLLAALAHALEAASRRARAVVVASEGRSFSAGADFRSAEGPGLGAEGGFATAARRFYAQALRVFRAEVPTVAAVHGPAIGAGLGLALACDLRVVGEDAWLQANFVRLGIHPGFGLTVTLPRAIGHAAAADLLLTGRRVGAEEAVRIGLADRVVASGEALAAARALAAEVASGAPLAVAATRRTLRSGLAEAVEAALERELTEQARLAETADAAEGIAAMLERRSPRFAGR
jgi:2-(1,2-epoxy-1,2-dihydrophenyl)acetyl-CoA isomerase